VLGFEVRVKA